MGEKGGVFLNDEELAAVEVLQENGWKFFSEVMVEKATPEGERWPSYVIGGQYPVGILRASGHVDDGKLPPDKKKRGRGRPKKEK